MNFCKFISVIFIINYIKNVELLVQPQRSNVASNKKKNIDQPNFNSPDKPLKDETERNSRLRTLLEDDIGLKSNEYNEENVDSLMTMFRSIRQTKGRNIDLDKECQEKGIMDKKSVALQITEKIDSLNIMDKRCELACTFEELGIMKNREISYPGLLHLVTDMFRDLELHRVTGYLLRMFSCLQALGGGGDRCNEAAKILMCGFMKQTKIISCMIGYTLVNGIRQCAYEILFEDNFDSSSIDTSKWRHTIKISSAEDNEFVVYNKTKENIFIKDGILHIQPTLMDDQMVREGSLDLSKCTGYYGSEECYHQAATFQILPPVYSAQISSKFAFRYGSVMIRAKLPKGDWIVPQMWLEPATKEYGPLFNSGRVLIASCNGNDILFENGKDISMRKLKAGVVMGVNKERDRQIYSSVNGFLPDLTPEWHDEFHNFTLEWTKE
ncbi:uncharacterized protein LOC142331121 [Lycorma delicatula]|uniref:uncharacterized protein LOC142331121 n=1 Tax=Lycorma delicatula TaxID=130591 RepID=UPI003F514DDF